MQMAVFFDASKSAVRRLWIEMTPWNHQKIGEAGKGSKCVT